MINIRELERIITDQAEELEIKRSKKYCRRMEQDLIDLDSPLAQVVIGVRRCGKSTMCFLALEEAGVKFAYVNFDDERLAMLNTDDLDSVLETLYKVYGNFSHLFLDEIQNIEGWHLFVNRLLRREMRIIVTGSNAKLLSGELSTHLTGRHHSINLFPFSFREFCEYKGVEIHGISTQKIASLRDAFDNYMSIGGFPQLSNVNNSRSYILDLTNSILKRDIEQRFKIRHTSNFERLAVHLMNISPAIVSTTNLMHDLKLGSANTVQRYIDYICQAYMLVPVHKYSNKSRQRLVNQKYYCIDPALMDKRPEAFSGDNLGWRLETIVFLELKRRSMLSDYDIYYLSESGRGECDFVICKGNTTIEAIQVSYDISNPKTLRRELNGLTRAAAITGCRNLTLLTDHEYRDVDHEGLHIKIRPVYDWAIQ